VTEEAVQFELSDGRAVSAPLAWSRLAHGTPAERAHWRLVGRGAAVHWPALDEDTSASKACSPGGCDAFNTPLSSNGTSPLSTQSNSGPGWSLSSAMKADPIAAERLRRAGLPMLAADGPCRKRAPRASCWITHGRRWR
jgi:hypothetical protein